jgi:hypothetical protein
MDFQPFKGGDAKYIAQHHQTLFLADSVYRLSYRKNPTYWKNPQNR